ncbi:MAG TPA: hypothetical protein VHI71_06810 [Actinomycetota bacterium]|nr:hypothetical protein [Actinomycetota bacterium]
MSDGTPVILAGLVIAAIVTLAIVGSREDNDAKQRPITTSIALLAGLLTGGSVATVSANDAAEQVQDQLQSDLEEAEADVKAKIDRATQVVVTETVPEPVPTAPADTTGTEGVRR